MSWDLEQALMYKLLNTAGVTAQVSTRIYPERLPDLATLPAITYQLISAPPESTHDESTSDTLVHSRIQFDSWAFSRAAATAAAKSLFDALHGFKGTVTDGGVNSYNIQSSLQVDRRSDNDPETTMYRVSQDFMFWSKE